VFVLAEVLVVSAGALPPSTLDEGGVREATVVLVSLFVCFYRVKLQARKWEAKDLSHFSLRWNCLPKNGGGINTSSFDVSAKAKGCVGEVGENIGFVCFVSVFTVISTSASEPEPPLLVTISTGSVRLGQNPACSFFSAGDETC
jgi:hypothetical protein